MARTDDAKLTCYAQPFSFWRRRYRVEAQIGILKEMLGCGLSK
jgi:hypothetical protein